MDAQTGDKEIRIRNMEVCDALAVSVLLAALGYPSTISDVERRFARFAGWPEQCLFIAEDAGGILGVCHVQGVPLLASEGYAEVQTLVVDAAVRRRGVGTALMHYA